MAEAPDFSQDLKEALNEIGSELSSKSGRVVIYNDDQNSKEAVIAALSTVVSPMQAHVEPTDNSMVVLSKIVDEATFLTLSAQRNGSQVVFEGPLEECDHIFFELTRGGADHDWLKTLAQLNINMVMHIIVDAASEYGLGVEEAGEIISRLVNDGEVDDLLLEAVAERLPRPVMKVEIVPVEDSDTDS